MSFWKNKNKPTIPEPPQYNTSYDDRPSGSRKYYEEDNAGELYPPAGGQQQGRSPSPYNQGYGDEYSQPPRDDYNRGADPYRPSNTLQKKPPPRDAIAAAREANSARSMPDRTSNRNAGIGESFTRHGEDIGAARNALFAGATVKPGGSGRYSENPSGEGGAGEEGEEEEDFESIQRNTKNVKQDSRMKTREALIALRQAEEQGRSVLNKLGTQSEQLGMTERHLQVSKGFIRRADDNTSDIKTLNRSIFIPAITFDKSKKRAAQDAKLASRYEEEKAEREATQNALNETQQIAAAGRGRGRDGPPGWGDEDEDEGLRKGTARYAEAKKGWSKYQTQDDDSEDDEIEAEISNNLNELSLGIGRVKQIALAQGEVVKRQNEQLKKLHSTVDDVDARLVNTTDRMRRI